MDQVKEFIKEKKSICIIVVVAIIIAIVGGVVGAIISNGKNNESSYNSMYSSCVDSINEMNDNSEAVITIISDIWQEAGPDKVGEILTSMLSATSENDEIKYSYYVEQALKLSSYSYNKKEKVYECAKIYQNSYMQITKSQNSVEEKLKELKRKYNKNHESEIQALLDYFSKSKSYAQLATNPTGSLLNYNSSKSNLKSDITELKQKAEFNK